MSEFQEMREELEKRKCTECQGLGECDDAEPGDIFFLKWTCEACKGTGLRAAEVVPAV